MSAGCSIYRMTIELTIIFRLISLKYFFNIRYAIIHTRLYKNIKAIGSIAARNILNMVEFGAKAFISLSSMNQSNETNDSDDDPIISPGVNIS